VQNLSREKTSHQATAGQAELILAGIVAPY